MTTNAATEGKLGELHGKIAEVMTNALAVTEKAQEQYLENEAEDIGPPPEVSAPLLSVMVKFLNDNKISCQIEDSNKMSDLAAQLEAKRKSRRQVGNVVHLTDTE